MRLITFGCLFFCLFILFSCAVTIPESDTTPPSFLFEITNGLPDGPIRISSEDDWSARQLNLRRNTLYRFRLTGSDNGGLAELRLRANWPTDFVDLRPAGEEIAVITDNTFFRELLWRGLRSEPLSGYIISGQLNTIMYNQSYAAVSVEWFFSASDFGGAAGRTNTAFRTLNVAIVDDTQPIGWVDLE